MRTAAIQTTKAKRLLQEYVTGFLLDCIGKDEENIKLIYVKYNNMWYDKCREHRINNKIRKSKNQVITLLDDAFESSCNNGRKHLKNRKQETQEDKTHNIEFSRIFRAVEHKTLTSKLSYWASKHFFVKSSQYKWNGDLKKQLKPIK